MKRRWQTSLVPQNLRNDMIVRSLGLFLFHIILDWVLEKPVTQKRQLVQTKDPGKSVLSPVKRPGKGAV